MRLVWLIIIMVFGSFLAVNGQDIHSQESLVSFVSVYMAQKSSTADPSFMMEALLKKHSVSRERYAEIFHRSQSHRHTPLSNDENALIQDLEKQNRKLANEKENALRKSCKDFSIEYKNYRIILHKYKTSIKFQRSLKPYFNHYINQRK